MPKEEEKLPENTVVLVAHNANAQIGNNKQTIDMPLYHDRTAKVNEPKGFLHFHIPKGVEIKVTVEIPFKGNIVQENLSLTDAMKIVRQANYAIGEIYGKELTVEDSMCNGNQVKITGSYST